MRAAAICRGAGLFERGAGARAAHDRLVGCRQHDRRRGQFRAALGDPDPAVRPDAHLLRDEPRRPAARRAVENPRSEEHTSELQSLMRISYAVFCLQKKKKKLIKPELYTTNQINKLNTQ